MAEPYDLVDRGSRREYHIVDFETAEICRSILTEASPGVSWAAASILSWLEFKSEGILRYRIRDMGPIINEIQAARSGKGSLWVEASYNEITKALRGLHSRGSIIKAVKELVQSGMVEQRIPDDYRQQNAPASYRLRVDRFKRSLDLLRDGKDPGLFVHHPVPQENHPDLQVDQGSSQIDQEHVHESPRAVPDKAQPSFTDVPPIDAGETEQLDETGKRAENLSFLLAAEISKKKGHAVEPDESWVQGARYLLDENDPDYLKRCVIWSVRHVFWGTMIRDMSSFMKHLASIKEQFVEHSGEDLDLLL